MNNRMHRVHPELREGVMSVGSLNDRQPQDDCAS
jgi:hypothetical protein